jgi:hypothetical protein
MELEKVLVIDPQTNVEETYKTKEVVYKSNVNKSLYKYNADSYSNTNIIFNNITPPSLNTVIPRNFRIQYQLTVGIAGVQGAGGARPTAYPNAVYGSAASLNGAPQGESIGNFITANGAQYNTTLADSPLQASCTAIELRINGSSTSISPNDWIMLYSHMVDLEDLNGDLSVLPHQKDTSAAYLGWATDGAQATIDNRSVFAPYGANTTYPSNTSVVWKLQTLGAAPTWTDVYTVDIEEELYLSPAVWGRLQEKVAGFSNINNFTLNFRMNNLARGVRVINAVTAAAAGVLQGPNGNFPAGITAITASILTAPQLNLTYITPDPVLAAKMPNVLAMDYSYIQPFITSYGVQLVPANFTPIGGVINYNSVRLPSIPKRIMIYAKPAKALFNTPQFNSTIADVFLNIQNISLTFNNRINLLNTETPFTLYQKSVANGLKDTWYDWNYGGGSVMIIDVAKDLGLEADECVGQANKYSTLQLNATFSNSNLMAAGLTQAHPCMSASNWDYYILVESPGKAFITPSDCQFVLTGPSSAEVLALTSTMDKVADQSDLDSKQVGGGAFGLGKLFKSGLNLVKNVDPEKVVQGLKGVQQTLGAMGLGVAGGAMKHKRVY